MTAGQDVERLAFLVHEVRSPVAALAAIAEAAAAGGLDDASRRDLVRLASNACAAIERLLRDAAVAGLRLETMRLEELVHDAAAAARLGGAAVRAEVPPGLSAVHGDPVRLRQALDNLIANAAAHSPPGSEVVISVEAREDGAAAISVSDRGEGIPEREHARIFEPGVRLATNRPGSGLGLAVARTIVEEHGGALTVVSEHGAGATFTILLPPG